MSQILIISNPFDLAHGMERHVCEEPLTAREWLALHFGPDFVEFQTPTVLQWNGEAVMRAEWETRRMEAGDILAFVHVPGVIEISLVTALIIGAVVGIAAYFLMPDPTLPNDQTQGSDSAYTLRGQTNRFRPNEPIEVIYGTVRHWPSYAARPYSEYSGNQQYQYSLFCVGQGYYDITELRLDDTDVTDYPEIETEIIEPGGEITLIESNVFTAAEVSNIELMGPNEEEYPGVSGPYTVVPAGETVKRLAVDVSFPRGLFEMTEKGRVGSESVELLFEYRLIDDDGDPLGSWTTLTNPTITREDNTPQRITFSASVANGRYEIRGSRVTDLSDSARSVSQVRWEAAKGYQALTADFGNVTLIAMKALATNSLNDSSAKKFNITATRKLPTWTPEDGWLARSATRNPIWAFCDVFRANYGAKLDAEFLDMQSLYALSETYETRNDWFDWVFDSPLTIWEAAKMIMRVGRAVPVPQGSLITAIRDVAQSLPSGVFNQHNIVKGSLRKTLAMFDFQPFDGVIVEYTDPDTWQPKDVTCVLEGRAGLNLDRVKFPGCTNRNRAYREGLYLQSRREYQRKTVTFQTGLEGHIPAYLDLISITHDTVRVGQGGMILAYNTSTNEMTLSESVRFASPNLAHKIVIRGDDGAILGDPITVTPGASPNKVILASDPDPALDFSENRVPPLFAFGVANVWGFMGKVIGIRPVDEKSVEITAVNYVAASYDGEDSTTIDANNVRIIRNPSNPRVEWVNITPVPDVAKRVYIDFPPLAGVAAYMVQTSYDAGDTWNNAGTHPAPPVEIPANPGTLVARVAAFSTNGNVKWRVSDSYVVGSNITPPVEPELKATQPAFVGTYARLKWDAVNGAIGYVVDVYADGVFMRTIEAGTALKADYTFDQYTADGGTGREIEFRLRSYNDGGESSDVIYTQTNDPPTTAPAGITAGTPTGTVYPISWTYTPEGDELEFRIYASPTPGFTPGPGNLVDTVAASPGELDTGGVTTYYRVAVVDIWGPELTLSAEQTI